MITKIPIVDDNENIEKAIEMAKSIHEAEVEAIVKELMFVTSRALIELEDK